MKTTLLLTTLLIGSSLSIMAQTRFIGGDYSEYFNWHNEHSQILDLYTPGTELYVFGEGVKLYQQPSEYSKVLAQLEDGQLMLNQSDYRRTAKIPDGEINGYRDIWYKVSTGVQGISGYVFGIHLAKGWQFVDLDRDHHKELIMLGVSPIARKAYDDIRAEVRILRNHQLVYTTLIPGLCVFEECASSPMLRILRDQPYQGAIVVEASTMTVGCYTGIERAFFYWNGHQLQNVFHAEYTINLEYERHPFQVQDPVAIRTMICNYKDQDKAFNPIWDCKEVQIPISPNPKVKNPVIRARAR